MKPHTRKWSKFTIKTPQKVKAPDFEYRDETEQLERALLVNSRDRMARAV